MRRVALTGATGFIGGRVGAHLLARGDEVRAIVRPASPRQPPAGATVIRAALDSAAHGALLRALEKVDVVVHLAGAVSAVDPRVYDTANVEGTRAIVEAARLAGVRLVHISSLAAAGPASIVRPLSEDDPPRPITPYGQSKLTAERVVSSATGLRWTVLRPAAVYGPGDRAMLPLFRLARLRLLPIVGRPDACYTFVYVDDVVRAVAAAIDVGSDGDVLFVGHQTPVTAREIVEAVARSLGRRGLEVRVPRPIARFVAEVSEAAGRAVGRPMPLNRSRYAELSAGGFVCRVDRLRDRLGIVAQVGFDEGIARTAEWYRREGWL